MRHRLKAIIDGKRYDTETATVLAHNAYWDGSNFERHGTNVHLYRTPNGRYFVGRSTCWQGTRSTIEAITPQQAMKLYEQLQVQEVTYEEAFPGAVAVDA